MPKVLIVIILLIITIGINGFWYTVKWGDSITAVAGKYKINAYLLAGVNNITDWDCIYAGQLLWVPADNNKYAVYMVKQNDYLLAIAKKLDVSVWKLAEMNGIFDLDNIVPGQKLNIPAK